MPCEVTFKGGPRDGQVKTYRMDPIVISCVDECRAKQMKLGVYKTGGTLQQRHTRKTAVAEWTETE